MDGWVVRQVGPEGSGSGISGSGPDVYNKSRGGGRVKECQDLGVVMEVEMLGQSSFGLRVTAEPWRLSF